MRRGMTLCGGVATLVLAMAPGGASAATITVDDAADDFFAPPGGTCALREAVQAANADSDFGGCTRVGTGSKDTITLAGGTTYALSRSGIDDTNSGGDLDITGKTTFAATKPGYARIDGNDLDRVIEVLAGARLDARKLEITDGRVPGSGQPGSGGGGIRNLGRIDLQRTILFDNEAQRGGDGCGCGGGIENRGRMDLDRVELKHNLATYDGGGLFAGGTEQAITRSTIEGGTAFSGGGIYAYKTLTVNASTIASNDVTGSPVTNNGGGIFVGLSNDDSLQLVNSTISGNRAAASGGGIFRFTGELKLNAVTVTGNTADLGSDGTGHGGGIDGGTFGTTTDDFSFRNTIIAGNLDLNPTDPAADCTRLAAGFGRHNLLTPDGGCPQVQGDVKASDPKLKPLADNGGHTYTHALKRSSPAVGRAGTRTAPSRDQRSHRRDKQPDIGAYER